MSQNATESRLTTHIDKQRHAIFEQLAELIAFHSVYHPHNEHYRVEHANAGNWVDAALTEIGLEVKAIATDDGSTTYLAHTPHSDDRPSVLLYSHYDVVPAGSTQDWTDDPYTLTERDGRWYARGAADCKGSIAMHLAALRALDEEIGLDNLGINLMVLVEGSEEQGGEGLEKLIESRPELFQADTMLIADAGNVAAGIPTITTALRGGAQLKISVDTLQAPVHSGLFGGVAPDATVALMTALNSLYDESGQTAIDGITPPDSPSDFDWSGATYDPETFRHDANVLDGVELFGKGDAQSIASQLWARPAATVTGFSSRPVEEAVNAVTHHAEAQINLRVPSHLDSAKAVEATVEHLRRHTPFGAHVDVEIIETFSPFSTSPDSDNFELFTEAMATAFGSKPLFSGNGASIPLTNVLKNANPSADIAVYGLCEPKTTIHSPDESVDPDEIIRLATTEALFLYRLSRQ